MLTGLKRPSWGQFQETLIAFSKTQVKRSASIKKWTGLIENATHKYMDRLEYKYVPLPVRVYENCVNMKIV